jgi:23S rRNA (cytosine1962-C5)-methyltransferase
LDFSPHALVGARRNFLLNGGDEAVAGCPHETVQADTFEWLALSRREFDVVVMDPPSLARLKAEREGAVKAYARLATLGLARLRPGGMLVAASCSAHVSAAEFFGAVRSAAQQSQRGFREWRTTAHPVDHPATFAEANYL